MIFICTLKEDVEGGGAELVQFPTAVLSYKIFLQLLKFSFYTNFGITSGGLFCFLTIFQSTPTPNFWIKLCWCKKKKKSSTSENETNAIPPPKKNFFSCQNKNKKILVRWSTERLYNKQNKVIYPPLTWQIRITWRAETCFQTQILTATAIMNHNRKVGWNYNHREVKNFLLQSDVLSVLAK